MKTLRAWYRTPVGQLLEVAEKQALGARMQRLTGAALLQLGGFGADARLGANTGRQWLAERPGDGAADCVLAFERLPFHSNTMDIVVLVHALEFSSEPHAVLREAERVLAPEGTLLVLGFNPWSAWGVTRAWRGHPGAEGPWAGRYLGPGRARDWLMLLGLELEDTDYLYFRPPWNSLKVQERLASLESFGQRWLPWLGGVYLTVAHKRVAALTPRRPRPQARRKLVAGGLPQPTSRNY
jgi:SAM-dependent methyltransferase